jgi:hypothetical protein
MGASVLVVLGIAGPATPQTDSSVRLASVALATPAKAGGVDASGTLGCSVSKGKLGVSPGLSFSGTASSATFTFTGKLACTGTAGVTGGTFTATGTSDNNNCGDLASQGIPALTMSIVWKGKFAPTTVVFSDGNFSIGATALTINLPSTGPSPPTGSTTVSGSFAYEPVTANFLADQSIDTFAAACNDAATGLTSFTYTGVNGPSILDINEQKAVVPPPPPASTPVTVDVNAASRGSAVNEGLIGVNHVVAGSQGALAAIGTQWARTDASLEVDQGTAQAAYNCTTGVWNPAYLDGNIALDKEAGATPELIVDYFPSCVDYQLSGLTALQTAARVKAWKALVYQMALHEITAEGVRVFEVWNEPSFYMPLKGKLGYLTLYKYTATELEKAAAAAGAPIEVGGPGVDELGQIDNTWISALAGYVVANHLPLDFVSWHQYPNDPDEGPQGPYPTGICDTGAGANGQPCWYNPNLDVSLFQRGAESVQNLLAGYPTLHPVLWVDEWGVDSGNDARLDGPYGAAFVAASLEGAQQGGIGRMAFYDTADNAASPEYDNFGLLFGDLSPKPAYDAFAMWHQLAGSLLAVSVSPDQSASAPVGQVGAVASVASDGTVHVMVYDFAPYDASGVYGTTDPTPFDHQVTVDLSGLASAGYGESQSLIDGSHADSVIGTSSVSGPSASMTFTLSGEGVTLITLTPGS